MNMTLCLCDKLLCSSRTSIERDIKSSHTLVDVPLSVLFGLRAKLPLLLSCPTRVSDIVTTGEPAGQSCKRCEDDCLLFWSVRWSL